MNDQKSSISNENELKSQLETSRQVLKVIFDGTQSSIFVVSPTLTIIFFNKKAKDLCQLLCGSDIQVGDDIFKFRIEYDEEEIFETLKDNFKKALAGSQVFNERALKVIGKTMWIRSEYTPVFDGQNILGVMLRVKEITERKNYELKIEKQIEKLKEIAWTQSHKTRQPVATILGLMNILDKDSLTGENKIIVELLGKTVAELEEVIRYTVIQANSSDDEDDIL